MVGTSSRVHRWDCRSRRLGALLPFIHALAFTVGVIAVPDHASAGGDPPQAEAKGVFEGRYAAVKAAMAARDSKAMGALLAPDFRSEDVTGNVQTGNEMVQQVSELPKDPNRVSDTTVLSVRVVGSTATVRQRYHMTTTKIGADGATHPVELTALSTDTWIMTDGVWLLRATVTDQLDYRLDGRVVSHREHGGQH